MKIYIIRHGETEWNKTGRLQGQTDIALNEKGRELAIQVGRALRDVPFRKVISSPLSRAVETARLVLDGRAVELVTDSRVEEISFGSYEGYSIPYSSLTSFDPKYAITDDAFHYFFDAPEKYHPPKGGESIGHLVERTGDFLRELAAEDWGEEDILLISTHGAASRALLANIKHSELKDFWKPGVPKNCSISIAETENGSWKLLEQDILY